MQNKFLFLLLITNFAVAETPRVTYEGGRYYIYKDGVQQEGYYLQDYTAKAAAVNLSFECGCPIMIKQPEIKVTTHLPLNDQKLVVLSWGIPTKRIDGTDLLPEEITHYVLNINGEDIEVKDQFYVFKDALVGDNKFKVATATADGIGPYSEEITVYMGE